jgi:probable rRNA maturation factor
MQLRHGKRIPRDDGTRIEEFVGHATTGTESFSLARMLAPPGWEEPPQTPRFDEAVLVLSGQLTLVLGKKRERIGRNEVGYVPRGTTVVYRNDGAGACDYVLICAPAFRPELAGFAPQRSRVQPNRVELDVRHRAGKPHAPKMISLAKRFLKTLGVEGHELSLAIVGDAQIRSLNRQWRKKDKATDVLSFPADPLPRGAPGLQPLGDVIVSLDTARRQAKEEGRTLDGELARYLAHGMLHLLGHDHHRPDQAARMAAAEEQLLGVAGMVPSPESVA